MAEPLTKDLILHTLSHIRMPDGNSLAQSGLLSEIAIVKDKVSFALNVTSGNPNAYEPIRKAAEDAVKALPQVTTATIVLTSDKKTSLATPLDTSDNTASVRGIGSVKHILAVASGKGGVGKSTTAVNLALAFRTIGLKTGVFDADIYGPSLPRLLSIKDKPELVGPNLLAPVENYGLKVMSMGFLVEEETPMIWRGPMVISAVTQMLKDVAWGELDIMVVDMPPGTGDAHLTMAQQVPLSGAVIVSTPQDLALIDARRGLNMFKRVNVPVLGIIENMSFFVCPKCGTRSDIFSHGGAREEASRLGLPFLGELPLHMAIRQTSDDGKPIVVSQPNSLHAQLYINIAERVSAALLGDSNKAPPKIIIET